MSRAEGVLERAGSQRGLSTLAFPGSLWEASGSRQVREGVGVVFGRFGRRRGRGSRAAADFFFFVCGSTVRILYHIYCMRVTAAEDFPRRSPSVGAVH